MSFLDRIAACTRHDPSRYRPFVLDGELLGRVRDDFAAALLEHDEVFVPALGTALADAAPSRPPPADLPPALSLHPALIDPSLRSAAVDVVIRDLADRGLVQWLGSELYPVVTRHRATPAFLLERSALPTLGARAFGVHMHGVVARPDGAHLWIARRARGKTTYPGKLDNMVAGGQPHGLGVRENLIKECGEEAGIPPELAARATATGALAYTLDTDRGLRRDTLFLFELELPEDFVPRPVDGEVESFELWPVAEVAARVRDSDDFKFNCNLVVIDYLLRHGWLGPDDPDYHALVAGLHGGWRG